MMLKTIVARLGGDLYDGGRRASIPAPGHSAADRSVSLLEADGRILIHSFGSADWRELRDHLEALGLLGETTGGAETAPELRSVRAATDPGRYEAPRRIWEQGRALGRTLSARHCRLRAIEGALPGSDALRHGPETPISAYAAAGPTRPALLAAVRDGQGALTAVEITYLLP